MTEAQAWAKLGEQVRQAREAKNLSRREAARQLGISEGHLRHLEHGGYRMRRGNWLLPTHSPETIMAVARFLDLDARRLLALVAPRRFAPMPFGPLTAAALATEIEQLRKEVEALRSEIDVLRDGESDRL